MTRRLMVGMWADALATFVGLHRPRWTVVVIDRDTADEYPIASVRFRRERSAHTWIDYARRRLLPSATYAVRPIEEMP